MKKTSLVIAAALVTVLATGCSTTNKSHPAANSSVPGNPSSAYGVKNRIEHRKNQTKGVIAKGEDKAREFANKVEDKVDQW